MWTELKRVIKPRGAIVLMASQPFTTTLISSNREWFKYLLVWHKSRQVNFLNARNRPMSIHEDVVVFSPGTTANRSENRMTYNPQKTHGKPYRKVDSTDPRTGAWAVGNRSAFASNVKENKDGSRFPVSVVYIENPNNGVEHPTQKPVALMEYLIRTYTNEGETVLDFCMGSGTTGVACHQTGRAFVGIERDPAYFAIAERRIAEAQSAHPLFAEAT